ncbi:NADP-dependent alcohol dehydrogenase 6 [Colletotrichum spaethianum]|uniref:alcohol dehydrogenase (NADP(+)) n=1 Tax=Colletotrichum spaethianum TaxID=700344 RepID=A0AA37L8T8_9PEZI|nr:NADP-dependent alcohol dehydrogenase 6 [Colletotrichum spaethianum]GKT44171.1 NADP-dependent alcohol dehydrogenase 6 [Colletotrichum spaethianum]
MAATDYKFEGWVGLDEKSSEGNMVWQQYDPKPWEETDVDIQITHSGVCGSDIHVLRSGWGPAPTPSASATRSSAEGGIKVGDRVGVGAQSDSCLGRQGDCEPCATKNEQYCPKSVHTYGAFHYNGGKAMGGHAKYHRCPSHFVVKIPDGLESAYAAPMLCGGVTNHGCGPGKTVAVSGVGGLGHMAIMLAKALGADKVVGISRKADKRDEVLKMGADDYIATAEEGDWAKKYANTFDLVISTVSSSKVPMQDYLNLIKLDGSLVQVGMPDDGAYTIAPAPLVMRRVKFTGSLIGSPHEIREMWELAAKKGVKPWIQVRPMSEANQAIVDLEEGKARYRYVLQN